MDLLSWNTVRVFITVFVVLFFGNFAYRVDGQEILKVAKVGDDITLSCYPPRYNSNDNHWYRNGTFLVNNKLNGNDSRITQRYVVSHNGTNSLYALDIADVNFGDSGTYICYRANLHDVVQIFSFQVIGCSCNVGHHDNSNRKNVTCNFENYGFDPATRFEVTIIISDGIYKRANFSGNTLWFGIRRNRLYKTFEFTFFPYSYTTSTITCKVPAILHTSTRYPTTVVMPTTRNGLSAASRTASKEETSDAPTKQHTTQKKNPGQDDSTGNITLIIVILGSTFILILMVVIIVLRCKQSKGRQKNKHNGNASTEKEYPPEACYESVEDGSRKGPENAKSIEKMRKTSRDQESVDDPDNGGLVDNILYDSSDRITENSISRVEGPLDNALYAMPDKRATINRGSTSKVVDRSSNSDILYGNSDIISQHEQSKDTIQREDQYENVEMPGSGSDAEEIQLYAMPDKGPKRNTLKTTPKPEKTSTLSKDDVIDSDALYAEVDKPKKK